MTTYFHWEAESLSMETDGGTITATLKNAESTLDAVVFYNGAKSMKIVPDGAPDAGNEPMGISATDEDIGVTYPFSINTMMSTGINLYYRWWWRIDSGFDWATTAKTKANRTAGDNGVANRQVYTGYMSEGGFRLQEMFHAGTDMSGASNEDFGIIAVDMNGYADNAWHEYIVRVKFNSADSTYDGEWEAYIDGESVGTQTGIKFISNQDHWGSGTGNLTAHGDKPYKDAWACWMMAPYFQLGAAGGGTMYLDDFSVDDAWNSIFEGGGGDVLGERIVSFGGQAVRVRLT